MNLYFPAQLPAIGLVNPSGHWLLQGDRAITVLSGGGGQLRVARGQVWATLGSAPGYKLRRTAPLERCATVKDYFLNAGDTLVVPSGVRLVMESMGRSQDLPVAFDWNFKAQSNQSSRMELTQATGELSAALGDVGRALRRLVVAVLTSPNQAQPLERVL